MEMFTSKFLGIMFSTRVTSNTYMLVFFSLPFLAWITPYIPVYNLALLFNIEFLFNQRSLTLFSSLLLFATNLLFGWITTKYYKEELDELSPMKAKKVEGNEENNKTTLKGAEKENQQSASKEGISNRKNQKAKNQ